MLSPKAHGVIDYLTVGLLAALPLIFMLDDVPAAVTGCLALAGGLLLTSLLTRYPLGVIRVVPFPVHGALEMLLVPLVAAYPWMAGFSDVPLARNIYLGVAGVLLVLWLITDYRGAERR